MTPRITQQHVAAIEVVIEPDSSDECNTALREIGLHLQSVVNSGEIREERALVPEPGTKYVVVADEVVALLREEPSPLVRVGIAQQEGDRLTLIITREYESESVSVPREEIEDVFSAMAGWQEHGPKRKEVYRIVQGWLSEDTQTESKVK